MDYKILVLDLDGTTVVHEEDSLPTDRVRDAVNKVSREIYVSVATGRPIKSALPVITHLNLSGLCVICNGIQLFDPTSNRIVEQYGIDKNVYEKLQQITERHGLELRAYDGYEDVDISVSNYENVLSYYLPKIGLDLIGTVEKELEAIENISVHKMPSWDKEGIALDITDVNVSKLHGISEIFKRLMISKDEAIGVGDSYNDFPLLMACGLKIAMGNAVPELKAIADFIAPSVDDDGVATIIEKFLM